MSLQKEESATSKGIYVLIICLNNDVSINVGALGQKTFQKGTYAYVGSAQKNLGQRLKRHLRSEKRTFWHIDYLLGNDTAKIIKVLFKQGSKAEECRVASEISKKGEAVGGFGCSDCHCRSHLFRFKDYRLLQPTLSEFDHLGRPPVAIFDPQVTQAPSFLAWFRRENTSVLQGGLRTASLKGKIEM